jgi:hypothetical protein
VGLTFVEAVILILKHTTSLWISNEELKSTLTLAEVDYQKANINLKIQEYLQASPEHSVEESAHFIMATDIGMLAITFVVTISHQAFSIVSAFDSGRRSLVEMVLGICTICQVHLGECRKGEWL